VGTYDDPKCDEHAEALLRQMESMVAKDDPELVRGYNLTLKACAIGSGTRKDSVRRGTDIFGQLMTLTTKPIPPSFAYMMQIVSHMPGSDERRFEIYEKIMRQSQGLGCVSDFVLQEFKRLAPTKLAKHVLQVENPKKLLWKDLPAEWRHNVRSKPERNPSMESKEQVLPSYPAFEVSMSTSNTCY
jgi:hypothetical protein